MYSIPIIKIEPNGITITNEIYRDDNKGNNYRTTTAQFFNDNKPEYNKFSEGARRRLKRAFNLLLAISPEQRFYDILQDKTVKFRINFITLTLSAKQNNYSDYTIKQQLLNHFLTDLRRKKGLTSYIWKAEPQKNNNIHFHITTNQYFNYQFIRDTWNNTQKKLGFINLFNEKHHHINPNSTDIHSVQNIKNSGAYIAKYISKINEDSRRINGKIWDCSTNLKLKEKCIIVGYGKEWDNLCMVEEIYEDRIYSGDYFKFIPLSEEEIKNTLPQTWKTEYNKYLEKVKNVKIEIPNL